MNRYLQLKSGSKPPLLNFGSPFRCVISVEENVNEEWQKNVSTWLVESGCLYMMAWGINCSQWDTSVDLANIELYDFEDIPDDKFVITTWHQDESLEDVFWYSKHNAYHSDVEIEQTLILHISNVNKESEYLDKYESA